jgi:spermidine synthase
MSAAPAPVKSVRGPAASLVIAATCLTLSGCAALIYQTAWTRQYALVFGTAELAVGTVLAAYLAGLALGAAVVDRLLPSIASPGRIYAWLEVGIGVAAVTWVPGVIWASGRLLLAWFGHQDAPPSATGWAQPAFYLCSAFVALVLPTALMGATLPLLARHVVRTEGQIGARVGLLYALNTAGAVVGALGTAFLLLPAFGLVRTIWVAALLNAAVAALALLLRSEAPAARAKAAPAATPAPRARPTPGGASSPAPPANGPLPNAARVLPLMLASGTIAFGYEVLWTRILGQLVGSSIHAFGVMVGSFLSGIALGGTLGAWLARTRPLAASALAISQLAAAVCGALAFVALGALLPGVGGLRPNLLFGFVLLLPLTVAIGATYPLAVRVLANDAASAGPASARVYAWNTVGGIAGALASAFWIIPALGYDGALSALVLAGVVLAALSWCALQQRPRWQYGAVAAAAVLVAVAFHPVLPRNVLLASPMNADPSGQVVFQGVGRSASVVVLRQDGGLALRTNGLPEALMESPGSVPRLSGEFWMSPLAQIARPDTRDVLVVGLGGGVVVEGVAPQVRRIDVIEIEAQVVVALRATRALRRFDALADPRVNVIENDARSALALTDRRYDAIVSQPSHPWTAGASHLYTREFMQLARAHLAPDGVFVQWMNVAFLDEQLLRSLTATLIDVFGSTRIYRPDPGTLVFVAGRGALDTERRLAHGGQPLESTPLHYARFGINCVEDLVAALAMDEAGTAEFARGAPLIDDDTNRMATSSVFDRARGLTPDAAGRLFAQYDPLRPGAAWLYADFGAALDFAYVARRLVLFRGVDPSALERMADIARRLGDAPASTYIRSLLLDVGGEPAAAHELLGAARLRWPDSALLTYAWAQPLQRSLAPGADEPALRVALDSAIAQLPAPAQAALNGIAALRAGRIGDIAAADALLASARWSEAWAPDAQQLRAEWRSRVSNPELAPALADQSIAIIDRLALLQPAAPLFAIRARAALAAQRPDVLLESAFSMTQWTLAAASGAPPEARARARAALQELLTLLASQKDDQRMDGVRLAEIRSRIDDAIEKLG